ncbi:MAG: hypothetical protein HQ536_04880 [Parcubacteria group bacterium]|nr:hypothetical protein [Parcubacteria group bacterium]
MSTKISTSKVVKIIQSSFWGVTIVFLIIAVVLSFFVYNNIYRSIAQSEEIVVLQGQLALEPVNISLFRGILTKIEEKIVGVVLQMDNVKNPFLPYTEVQNNEEVQNGEQESA